ncbi:isocitrate/isopropylmalate dehydrogenase family protein [Candidatus Woesearchaeota archaeon]|nr:isocitrate/isopropylmalate dehydrogenase family protein [Candidatus Woesearchaeota archaeon]MBT5272742.1 isocitrate/isopropylmalate dehydrogenase family protein [Candidatus Woesearchaeota archaeon]MBT6040353.1 isocitrate/isopropylmalate dehydrogenase family protein [Candidatus Woesearchaeota archaeon]MBT6337013.1 isocitrate/isopropylmalate dehydrogenase family protein [Candidatus Woesearchaeota archaeon]
MTEYNLCILPGDGIGPEVIQEAVRVLNTLAETSNEIIEFNYTYGDIGYGAYQKLGNPLPEETLEKVKTADATLFGAVTTPPNIPNYSSPILGLRKHFDLFVNLRPCVSMPHPTSKDNINITIFRENTEGLYSKVEHVDKDENGVVTRAVTERIITRKSSERIIRHAFEYAKTNNISKVTVVHKANVLRETCGLFRVVAQEVAQNYQDIEMQEMLVDNCAMQLIRAPEQFQVIVTTNLFGDILSDEASMLVGGLGMACSGNIGTDTAIFEPVHGSAPDITGQEKANPIATLLSAKLMLDHLGLTNEANKLENAIKKAMQNNMLTPDLGGNLTTAQVTDNIIRILKES